MAAQANNPAAAMMSIRITPAIVFIGIIVLIISNPMAAGAQAGTGLLYICNQGSGNISIIDPGTGVVVGGIERPSLPYGTALSPDGARLYVAGGYSNSVTVIDTASGNLIDTVKIDSGLDGGLDFSPCIAVSPDGKSLCAMDDYGYWIKVVNASTFNMTSVSTTRARSCGAAFGRDGQTLYVAGGNGIYAIGTGTGKVKGSISFLGYPVGVSVSPDGEHVYGAVISKSSYDRLYPSDCPTCTCCLYPGLLAQMVSGLANGKGTPGTDDADAIYEINARSLSVEAVIPLENAPRAYAAGPGDIVYVACNGPYSNYLYAIDAKAKNVTDKILLGPGLSRSYWSLPALMAASPDGSRVYLAESMDNRLLTVNMADHNVTELSLGARPTSISAGLSKAFVSLEWDNKVLVIDPGNNTIARTLNYWWDPKDIRLSPDGSRAYALSEAGNFITAIDTKDDRIIADIPVGKMPSALAMSPDGSEVCVSNFDDDTVTMIDVANNTVKGTIRVGLYPDSLAFSPDGAVLYVTCQEPALMAIEPRTGSVLRADIPKNDSLYAIDARTGNVSWTMDVRYSPAGIAVSPDGSRLYVTCRNETSYNIGSVRVIDAHNRSLVKSIEVGKEPEGIWSSPDGSRLYVTHLFLNKLTVIDTGTDAVTTTPGLEYSMMKYLAMSPDGSRLYLTTGGFVTTDIVAIDASNNTACGVIKAGFSPAGMAVKKAH